jgi:hypothetical protein
VHPSWLKADGRTVPGMVKSTKRNTEINGGVEGSGRERVCTVREGSMQTFLWESRATFT